MRMQDRCEWPDEYEERLRFSSLLIACGARDAIVRRSNGRLPGRSPLLRAAAAWGSAAALSLPAAALRPSVVDFASVLSPLGGRGWGLWALQWGAVGTR